MILHLADAEFHLAHDDVVHAAEACAVVSDDEGAVEGDVVAHEGGSVVAVGCGHEVALRRQGGGGHDGCLRQPPQRGLLDECSGGVDVGDVVARQLGDARRAMRLPGEETLSDEPLDRGLGGGAGDAVPHGHRGLGDQRARRQVGRDDAGSEGFVDGIRQRRRFQGDRHGSLHWRYVDTTT